MSFYRTYRPHVIAEIDNPSIRSQLTSFLSKKPSELPHAFFLTGPKGTGKTTAARVIAKLFNCEKLTKSGPCGTCDQCTHITNGSSLDCIEMDAASNRGIDEIRALREKIGLAPVSAPYTIYIIDEVHMLTNEAFNALLKTIEEPPKHVVFILATTDAHKVPDTITSRCVPLQFTKATREELIHVIERIAHAEHIAIDTRAIERIAAAADGSYRDAAKYLEQVSLHTGAVTIDVVQSLLSLSDATLRTEFITYLQQKNTKGALSTIEALDKGGTDMKSFMSDILNDLHMRLLATARGEANDGWTKDALVECIRACTAAFSELRYSPIVTLPLELAVIEFCGIADVSEQVPVVPTVVEKAPATPLGLITVEKLIEYWPDFIAALKPYNHSVAGVLRSSRPKAVENGIVTIEAFYSFHQEKLNDAKTRAILSDVLKRLFGEKVKVEIVLGKK